MPERIVDQLAAFATDTDSERLPAEVDPDRLAADTLNVVLAGLFQM